MDKCSHRQPRIQQDTLYVIGAIFALFVIREIWCWLTKTNHILTELREIRRMLKR